MAAKNGEIVAVWEKMAPAVDESLLGASTAEGVCAISMMLAYVAGNLSDNVKFGTSPEDEGETVHPNFCIMAIALLAVNTMKASLIAQQSANDGDGDGEEKGKEESSEENTREETGGNSEPT